LGAEIKKKLGADNFSANANLPSLIRQKPCVYFEPLQEGREDAVQISIFQFSEVKLCQHKWIKFYSIPELRIYLANNYELATNPKSLMILMFYFIRQKSEGTSDKEG
jgi:hypothetical protein